jgi:hypothetical protein
VNKNIQMECSMLDDLYKLCPYSTNISILIKKETDEKYFTTLSKFKKLSELTISDPQAFETTPFMFMNLDVRENKLEKLNLDFNFQDKMVYAEFLEVLFKTTNLKTFERTLQNMSPEESKIISDWLTKNTSVTELNLNRL